jgi:4-hydroxy-3-methylbut-2-enyl diphosphate reductase
MPETKLFQKGLGLKAEVQAPLQKDYKGWIVDLARANDFRLQAGELTIRLAKEFGFCYGVDRAVEYAYEARTRFPDRDIYITGEIIHNPYVNRRLEEMGIRFLDGPYGTVQKFEPISASDVVLLPAFGVSTTEMEILRGRGCILVDTTCGSVLNVWKNVERYARSGFTSIVHGKYWHEETKATISRATRFPGGHYLVVRDMDEAQAVCIYIEQGGDAHAFLRKFSSCCSPSFDPDRELEKIGLANQTTMLSSESLAIEGKLRKAMARRHGEAELANRFRSFDTICSATQERQDAVVELMREKVDLMLVLGGYNSSNTTHLAEISSKHSPTYHIADSSCLVSPTEIRHKPVHENDEAVTRNWLSTGPLTVGITAGASTPDVKVDESIERLISFRGLALSELKPV